MAVAKTYNIARMSTATTGTGTITLGSAVSGYISFATAGVSDGETITYAIEEGVNREIGRGVYTASGTTLTRSVLKSTNSGSAINLGGAAQVFITVAAEDVSPLYASAADKYLYSSGVGAWSEGSITTAGRAILDDADASAQRTTLGVGTADSPQFTAIELGHASDTSITRTGAGAIAVEGVGVALNSTSLAHTASTIELGHASDTTLSRSAAGILAVEGVIVKNVGKETIWIPASAMTARTTNGAAAGSTEMSTNKNMFVTKDFDTTTQEFVQFEIFFPKSWNLGTVTFQPLWSHPSTTTNFGVVFGLAGIARSDDDAGDVAFGTAQTSTDTGGTTNDIYVEPESSAITIAGTPAAGDSVQFQINRTVADGSDTMAVDARLHGIRLFFTTSAATDA